ncbi:branched-chain amino acid ABC transporter permease [Pikeienuella piscinae]|uniref:Branched-chain amino acid ABC transporter permease n=1 Tax=Pikeienuella piscinae TaxID=2748098 RepID=A0A7L5BVD2_9RHOB|nr:branched-chain amino acid ABC transporter permease [Pikeienuella piscinae]QIE55805.1 branched-chain amino acid ABC transporter permease [Pikeienuella piscinae]
MALTEERPAEIAAVRESRIPLAYWLVGAILIVMPAIAGDYALYQIFGWTFILGMIALSLMFLAGYGGMVSLVQMTVAGLAGYMVAIFGTSAITDISQGWPWYLAIPLALIVAMVFGTLTGWLAVRTEGIYTIMITLAIASAFFYFVRQNYVVFNGFNGLNGILPPPLFGVDWRGPTAFYYLTLFWAALAYFAVLYLSRAPFGLALQGVRDNPRRMAALGYNVNAHRVAAYAFAALIAGIGGILLTWQSAQVSPGTVGVGPVIDILIIAVIGGVRHPIGPFIGALIYVILKTFATDALVGLGLAGERFQLLIGIGFLAIVFWSPDGILGLWEKWKASRGRDPLLDRDEAKF